MPGTDELVTAFVAALPPELQRAFAAWPELGGELERVLAEAERAWPGIELEPLGFASYLAERTAPDEEAAELPRHSVDLALAWACTTGSDAALRHFDRGVLQKTHRVLARLGLSAADADDVVQNLRTRLLLPGEGTPPGLTKYQGTGPLVAWASTAAGRLGLAHLRARRPSDELDEDLLVAADDPYMTALRQRHRGAFRIAFEAAVASLDARDRLVLRALLVDNRSVGEVAALFAIHRVTASRWIAKIRQTLLRDTRHRLQVALDLGDSDLDSIMRLVDSQLDLSLYRVLN